MLRRLQTEHTLALKELFSIIRSDPSAESFHPHGFSAADAARTAAYTGRDVYAGYFAENGELVAYGMLRGIDEGYQIPSLGIYVAPAARGKGVSSRVMNGLHELARRDLGASKIMLKVYSDNLPALNLYKRIGYKFGDGKNRELVGYFSFDRAAE
jgi:RimJ/RimL family protein N-acetyltransferase